MLRLSLISPIITIVMFLLPSQVGAQYMFLDANGDGLNTPADRLNQVGTTTLDLYTASVPALGAAYLSFDTGTSPQAATIGDLNADGRPDFVTANQTSNSISVFLAQGDGTYRSYASRVDYATGSQPKDVKLVDLNGDGKRDVVSANLERTLFRS